MAKSPSYMTVLRWVYYLGFKQDNFKKSYYVDGHEHPSQIAHRNKFTNQYLTNLEPRSHRWVQIPKDVYEATIALLPTRPLACGYEYENEMLEFHVDDHDCLQEYATPRIWSPSAASRGKISIEPSLTMHLNVGPQMNWVFSSIILHRRVLTTRGNGGGFHFTIDR